MILKIYRLEETEYEKDVPPEELETPPFYNIMFLLPEAAQKEIPLKVSQKLSTSVLLRKISYLLKVSKDRIILSGNYSDLTNESLSRLNSKKINKIL